MLFRLIATCALATLLTACGGSRPTVPAADTGASAPIAPIAPVTPAASASPCAGLPSAEALLQAINTARSQARRCGTTPYPAVAPLAWNPLLATAAQGHADDMARNNFMGHTGTNGSTGEDRINATGYAWSAYGENVAAGQPTAQAVLDAWLASAGHCANLMNARFRDVAQACASRSGTSFGVYWTQVFGTPR